MFAMKIVDDLDLSELEPGYDGRNKSCKMVALEPIGFSLLPAPKQKVPEPVPSTEPVAGEREDHLGIDDISDMELYEGCDDQAISAGGARSTPEKEGAKTAEKTR